MGKNKKEKPELTLENLNRAIRTYQREEVLYLIQHGILKDIPEDEKTATYQQLVSLQNMEILQSVARQENFLDPEIFCNQSDSSQSKVFVNQCLTKFRKQFLLQDDDVCNTLFTLACACGCISMLHILIEQKKVKESGTCTIFSGCIKNSKRNSCRYDVRHGSGAAVFSCCHICGL